MRNKTNNLFLRAWYPNGMPCDNPLDRRYAWLVQKDPSGHFAFKHFQWQDVQTSANMKVWPEGIQFINVFTGQRLLYQNGDLNAF